jgi:hypothetical protein
VVIGGKLQPVTTLEELMQWYAGKKIINIGYGNISGYEKIVPAAKRYADGALLRGTNKRIYVLVGGRKKLVLNLSELRLKYRNRLINNVSNDVLNQY